MSLLTVLVLFVIGGMIGASMYAFCMGRKIDKAIPNNKKEMEEINKVIKNSYI